MGASIFKFQVAREPLVNSRSKALHSNLLKRTSVSWNRSFFCFYSSVLLFLIVSRGISRLRDCPSVFSQSF